MVVLNNSTEDAAEAGRQVAMQVAAMNPIAINKDGVDARTIEREIEVGKDLAIQEGKPADMAEKIAMGRLNRPSLMLYGGTIAPGHYNGQDLNIVSAFEALGQKMAGQLDEADFMGIVKHACPGAGACGGMYTANTMASAIEALGMSLPYSSSNPALSDEKKQECKDAGAAIRLLLERDIKPRDIMTRKAFENAVAVIMVLGGSTNAVLHIIAMAKSVGVSFTQDDFQIIS
jgi:dihydroxy-acid dehydratase